MLWGAILEMVSLKYGFIESWGAEGRSNRPPLFGETYAWVFSLFALHVG